MVQPLSIFSAGTSGYWQHALLLFGGKYVSVAFMSSMRPLPSNCCEIAYRCLELVIIRNAATLGAW